MSQPVDADEPPKMPRWVKVAAILGAIVLVLVIVVLLTGGPGAHGPGRHLGT